MGEIICGIYSIRSTKSNRIYVGSSKNIFLRWSMHRSMLRSGKHGNIILQRAWNKYGEDSFEFKVLEECPLDFLIVYEQDWMERLNAPMSKGGMNINPIAERGNSCPKNHSSRRKQFKLYNPDGKLVEAVGIRAFAEEHGLDRDSVRKLLKGRMIDHKGWRLEPLELRYFISPDGECVGFKSRKDLSLAVGIDAGDIWNRKAFSCGGWSYEGASCPWKPRRVKELVGDGITGENEWNNRLLAKFKLISPEGKVVECVGVGRTAKMIGCGKQCLIRLRNGESNSVKGWRLPVSS